MLRALCILLVSVASSGCWRGEVVRVVDGVEVPGRFVTDRAYASYLRAAEHEARGQRDAALEWYREAARWDGDSPEIWTRIGALSCGQAGGEQAQAKPRAEADAEQAEEAFARAGEIDPNYEPLWRERARCADRRGQGEPALAAARQAVALDPRREETVLLLVDLLQRGPSAGAGPEDRGRMVEAERWLRDLTVRRPDSLRVWTAVRAHTALTGDEAWAHEAEQRLLALGERLGAAADAGPRTAPSPWSGVDAALLRGSIEEARRRLRVAHLDSRLLAARAIVVGRADLGRDEAALRAAADPGDDDAQVALALAADLLGDRATTTQALNTLAQSSARLGGAARWLFAELLWRRGGEQAARLWLGDDAAPIEGLDGLRAALEASFEAARP